MGNYGPFGVENSNLTADFGLWAVPTSVNVQLLGAEPAAGGVILTWFVLGDAPTAFQVWRVDNAKGHGAVRLTEAPVFQVAPGAYRYADLTALPGVTYWYQVEHVGDGQRYGPVVAQPLARPMRRFLPMIQRP